MLTCYKSTYGIKPRLCPAINQRPSASDAGWDGGEIRVPQALKVATGSNF